MSLKRAVPLGAAVMAVALMFAADPQPAAAAYPGENGKIAFVRDGDIWVLEGESDSTPERLMDSPTQDADPAWSPGGTMLAFSRQVWHPAVGRLQWDIFVRYADGVVKRATTDPSNDRSPAWSPDASSILFTSERSGSGDIYALYLAVHSVDPIWGDYQVTSSRAADIDPAWSPDGRRVLYASNPDGQFDLYYIRADMASCCGGGFWSPDRGRLWPTAPDVVDDVAPAWSPDGSTVAWTRAPGHAPDIVSMSPVAIGGSGDPLIAGATADRAPAFSPDGQWMLFARTSGDSDVFVTGAGDATVQQNLTPTSAADDLTPDWQPVPTFPLVDARFSPFVADIQWMYGAGITTGYGNERFAPLFIVERGQMAAFLDRALEFDPTMEDFFVDDESSIFEGSINRLAAAGVTTGCGDGRFCPGVAVSRGAMAAYIVRALDLPATDEDFFPDDEDSIFEDDINRLAAAGLTTGTANGTYRPDVLVTRGEMAAFLHRALAP